MKKQFLYLFIIGFLTSGVSLRLHAEKVQFNQLPEAVQKAVQTQAGTAVIEDIDRTTRDGRPVYEVAFKKNGQHTEIRVNEDGTLEGEALKPAPAVSPATPQQRIQSRPSAQATVPLSGATKVTLDQVPEPARQAILSQAGGATIEDIDKGTLEGKTVYQAAFKRNGEHIEMRVAEGGDLISPNIAARLMTRRELVQTQFRALPANVQRTIANQIGNAEVTDVDTDKVDGRTVYEVAYRKGAAEERLWVGNDGSLIQSSADDLQVSGQDKISRKITMNELPPAVQNTIRTHAGRARIEDIDVRTENGRKVYQAAYKRNGQHTELLVSETGRVLGVFGEAVGGTSARPEAGRQRGGSVAEPEMTGLPAPVRNAITFRVGKGQIEKIQRERIGRETYYEVEFERNGRKEEFHVREDGHVLDQK